MKKSYCILTVLFAGIIFVTAYFVQLIYAGALPSNAKLIQENGTVRLYDVNIPDDSSVDGTERAYITDGRKRLAVLSILHDWTASIILVTDENVIVLSDTSTHPGQSGQIYAISRKDGAVSYKPMSGSYFFTDPDNTYAAFGTSSGTVELTSFGTDVSRGYSLGGQFFVGGMALSPDGNRIVVLASDLDRLTSEIIFASVFVIDIEKDAERQLATKIISFTESNQGGPFVPFITAVPIVWDSDTQVTITDDYGGVHEIAIPN